MPERSARCRQKATSVRSFSARPRGRETAKERLGRSKLAMTTKGSTSPSAPTMSLRTARVAVAVSAITGGRAGSAPRNSMIRW